MTASEKPRVIDTNDVLEVLEDAREPFLSTGEVTERLPASKPTVRDRLQSLEEEGLVRYRVLGANTSAWYLPELENRRLPEYDDGETPGDGGDGDARGSEGKEGGEEKDRGEIRTDGGKTSFEGAVDGSLLGGFVIGVVNGLAHLLSPPSELLASVALGGWATVAIMVPLRGLGIDRRVGRWFDGVRDVVDDEGGPVAFIKRRASEESLGPENPRTPFERVARYDLRAFVILIVAGSLAGLISGVYYTVGVEAVFGTPLGELLLLLSAAVVLLFALGTVLLWLAILASVAVESPRLWAGSEQLEEYLE